MQKLLSFEYKKIRDNKIEGRVQEGVPQQNKSMITSTYKAGMYELQDNYNYNYSLYVQCSTN